MSAPAAPTTSTEQQPQKPQLQRSHSAIPSTPQQKNSSDDPSPSVYPPTPAAPPSSLPRSPYSVGAVGRGASAAFMARAVSARAERGEVSENSQADRFLAQAAQNIRLKDGQVAAVAREGSLHELTRRAVADARAINYSASTNLDAGLGRSHPYAQVEDDYGADLASPIELRTPVSKRPPAGLGLPAPPPAAPAPRRHAPVAGQTRATLNGVRGRSASNGSSASLGGVNKDELLAGLADALEEERHRAREMALEVGRGEEEIDEIKAGIKSTRAIYDASYEEQAQMIAALQIELDDVLHELEGAGDLSAGDAAAYLALLRDDHPSLNSIRSASPSGVVTGFDASALASPTSVPNSAILAAAQGSPPANPSKLSRAAKKKQLEEQLGLVNGPATPQEPDGAVVEVSRGRQGSIVGRVVRALSRSRSRTREKDQLEELERRVQDSPGKESNSRRHPPISGAGGGGRPLGRKRSTSLSNAVKGIGRALFPSNAPSQQHNQQQGLDVVPQDETQQQHEAEKKEGQAGVEEWLKKTRSKSPEIERATFGTQPGAGAVAGEGAGGDVANGVWM